MTKLVSLNIGVRLTIQDEHDKELNIGLSAIADYDRNTVDEVIQSLIEFLNSHLGSNVSIDGEFWQHKVVKPSKIKAPRPISHKTFNRRVKKNMEQLGYKE